MVETALANRPDIRAAQAQIAGTHAAVNLAKGDRIPTPVIGPAVRDGRGRRAVRRPGLHHPACRSGTTASRWSGSARPSTTAPAVAAAQAQQRAVAQVRAAVARWNGATDLVNDSSGLSQELAKEVAGLERLFELRQTDLIRLMQARQRLIQLDNSRLDAVWAATQAQADLLLALGTPALIHGMLNQAQQDATPAPAPGGTPAPTMPSPFPSALSSPAASSMARPAAALAAPAVNPSAPVRR